jgi:hypothetical protein
LTSVGSAAGSGKTGVSRHIVGTSRSRIGSGNRFKIGAISAPIFSLHMIFSALASPAEAGVAEAGDHQFRCIAEKSMRSNHRADSPLCLSRHVYCPGAAEAGGLDGLMPAGKTEAQFTIAIIVVEPCNIIVQSPTSSRLAQRAQPTMNFDHIETTAHIEMIILFGFIL